MKIRIEWLDDGRGTLEQRNFDRYGAATDFMAGLIKNGVAYIQLRVIA